MSYTFFLGCYTNQNKNSEAMKAEGIYRLIVSDEGKLLESPVLAAPMDSPTYFYLSKDKKVLYAVSESDGRGKSIAFHVTAEGELVRFSEQLAAGKGLCHANMDKDEENLVVVCYPEATIQVYPVNKDRSISPMFCLRRHEGSGPVADRQECAHAHSATFTPDDKYMVVCDLGTDTLNVYTMMEESGKLHRAYGKNVSTPAGSGPRHMTFSPNGKFAYVACELNNEVLTLSYEDETLTIIDRTQTLSPDFQSGTNYPSAIRINKNGTRLYVSNRGEDTIAVFKVNPESGRIVRLENYSVRGWFPRDFILTEDEKYLIAVNQLSDNMAIFRIQEDGGLILTDEKTIVQKPVALVEI